jgi:hypothetical protein
MTRLVDAARTNPVSTTSRCDPPKAGRQIARRKPGPGAREPVGPVAARGVAPGAPTTFTTSAVGGIRLYRSQKWPELLRNQNKTKLNFCFDPY